MPLTQREWIGWGLAAVGAAAGVLGVYTKTGATWSDVWLAVSGAGGVLAAAWAAWAKASAPPAVTIVAAPASK